MHLIAAAVITLQLMNTVDIDGDERIAASRVVYSMAINVAIIVSICTNPVLLLLLMPLGSSSALLVAGRAWPEIGRASCRERV